MKLFPVIAAIVVAAIAARSAHSQEKKAELVPVKYEGLKQELLKHRGKVVIVDFWASNCDPCRKKFPFFVELHEKYAAKGLVVISVSVDPAVQLEENIAEGIAAAKRFIEKQQPPFRNLLLDESAATVTKHFGFKGLPFYYFFDRKGNWIRFRAADPGGVPYDKLDELVVKMLDGK
ncbi:MAG: TlpA family protein disulfide reductase [Planctomycetes bacterium]|nr:TlpA family protein disulfide reductase [Planctomycetota bacterium]